MNQTTRCGVKDMERIFIPLMIIGLLGAIVYRVFYVAPLTKKEHCQLECPIPLTEGTDWGCVKYCMEIK